jgi:membrane associated rhomboid family serine protease
VTEPLQPQTRSVSLALPLHKPVATWVLLAFILAVFAAETLLGGSTDTEVLVRLGAKVTPLIAAGEYWRLFTSMFLHIGWLHLAFNVYALFVVGTELERLLDWGRFLAIYFFSGLFGSLTSYAFSTNLSAGASGAIFGLIGALAAFFTVHRRQLGAWGRSRLTNIAFLIAINLFLGFTQPHIDNLAHVGGLVSGFFLGWALVPRYRLDPVALALVDDNRLGRYWVALLVAGSLLVVGTVVATVYQADSAQSHLLRAQDALAREAWQEAANEIEQALAQDPDVAGASSYFSLGLARNYLGQPGTRARPLESGPYLQGAGPV